MTTQSDSDLAKNRYLMLQRAARQLGRPTDELMLIYVLEGFLARLGSSDHASKLVLKGGMLLAVFTERRPTRDIDLQAIDLANEVEIVGSLVSDIASTHKRDGVKFAVSTTSTELIREGDDYSGIRVSMDAGLHTAKLRLKVDVNVGDPVWPQPMEIEVPSVLKELAPIRLVGYPLPMVLAEKIVTAVARGVASTRWRDFADIVLLSATNRVDGGELQGAMAAVADYRQVELSPLHEVLDGYVGFAQKRWELWLERQGLEDRLSFDFGEVLERVFAFADPALSSLVENSTWISDRGWAPR